MMKRVRHRGEKRKKKYIWCAFVCPDIREWKKGRRKEEKDEEEERVRNREWRKRKRRKPRTWKKRVRH